jgi:hypothetical protein
MVVEVGSTISKVCLARTCSFNIATKDVYTRLSHADRTDLFTPIYGKSVLGHD